MATSSNTTSTKPSDGSMVAPLMIRSLLSPPGSMATVATPTVVPRVPSSPITPLPSLVGSPVRSMAAWNACVGSALMAFITSDAVLTPNSMKTTNRPSVSWNSAVTGSPGVATSANTMSMSPKAGSSVVAVTSRSLFSPRGRTRALPKPIVLPMAAGSASNPKPVLTRSMLVSGAAVNTSCVSWRLIASIRSCAVVVAGSKPRINIPKKSS